MDFMTAQQTQMYNLGRDARQQGFEKNSCNLEQFNPKRAFWLAGWHDLDMELKHEPNIWKNNADE